MSQCPETYFGFSLSANTIANDASRYLCNIHAPEAPCEVYLSTTAFSLACASSVHLGSTWCALSCCIGTSGFPFASCKSDNLPTIQGFPIGIILSAASRGASLTSVQMAWVYLFTVESSDSVLCFSMMVSSSGSSDASENCHIVWNYHGQSELNPGLTVTWIFNPILTFIAIRQHTLFSSCWDEIHQISLNSMNSVRVSHCLMAWHLMLRYYTKQGGYGIGFSAR